ncbi:hypothetical protein D3C72_2092830 [compost metagenome]
MMETAGNIQERRPHRCKNKFDDISCKQNFQPDVEAILTDKGDGTKNQCIYKRADHRTPVISNP